MSWLRPESAEPTRKIAIEPMKTPLRPWRSPSLAHTGVETAVVSAYAVTTHAWCARPPSSPTIVGIAVPTIVLSSIASRIAVMSPPMTVQMSRRVGVRSMKQTYLSTG
jgi:hypothetical protein